MARKKNGCDCKPGLPGWMATFSDMMTLLLTFFVLLLSMSSLDNQKIKEALGSLKGSLGVLQGGSKTDISLRELLPSPEIVDISPRKLMDREFSDVKKRLYQLQKDKAIEADMTKEGILLNVDSGVLFESSSAELSSAAGPVLREITALIKERDIKVRIEGHTDNVPIETARYPSNWELSTARAVNVLRHFTEGESLDASRFSAVGYGDTQPVASNDTPEGRAKNRRVVLVLLYPQSAKEALAPLRKARAAAPITGRTKRKGPVRFSLNMKKALKQGTGGD